jgi:5-methylcytosine-specific restriction enzyme subunit McrC
LGQDGGNRRATILYPTLEDTARQQVIRVMDPHRSQSKAEVVLRPVNLLKLALLLSDEGIHAQRERRDFAMRLVFGGPAELSMN